MASIKCGIHVSFTDRQAFIVSETDPSISVLSQIALRSFTKYQTTVRESASATMLSAVPVWDEEKGYFQIAIDVGKNSETKTLSQAYQTSVLDWFKANPTVERRDPEAIRDLAWNARKSLGERFEGLDLVLLPAAHHYESMPYRDGPWENPSQVLVVSTFWSAAHGTSMIDIGPPTGVNYTEDTLLLQKEYEMELTVLRDNSADVHHDPFRTRDLALLGATRVLAADKKWTDFRIVVPKIGSTRRQRMLMERNDGFLATQPQQSFMRRPHLRSHSFTEPDIPASTDNETLALTEKFTSITAHLPPDYPIKGLVAKVSWNDCIRCWSVISGGDLRDDIKRLSSAYCEAITRLAWKRSTNLRDAGAVHADAIDAITEILAEPEWHRYDIHLLLRDPYATARMPRRPHLSLKRRNLSADVNTTERDPSAVLESLVLWNGTWYLKVGSKDDSVLTVCQIQAIKAFMAQMEKEQSSSQGPSPMPHDPYPLLRAAKAARLVLLDDTRFKDLTIEVPRIVSNSQWVKLSDLCPSAASRLQVLGYVQAACSGQ
ncbi:hypothetical protein M231_01653 [Tremella mesenterica]|uniref:Uncharacterized protein n=1 Tax=Tremella mesenterica TaxID=5217 RepID=A0A4Q1BSZ7_TREME|nr:hypothetical protein M231_01653 [Tremella mesenterica]